MYLTKTPSLIQNLFPNLIWRMKPEEKVLYLTFDDGPIPEATPWILDTLREYNAKASFFCVGENIQKHPAIYNRIKAEGHSVGNHTFNHLSGWTTENSKYNDNIAHCEPINDTTLFRPPYGRITPNQVRDVSEQYTIVMWDVLSGDFDEQIDADTCFRNVINNTQNGSIIVLHDSLKTIEKIIIVLPKLLEYYGSMGYRFDNLEILN